MSDYRDATDQCPACSGSGFVCPGEADHIADLLPKLRAAEEQTDYWMRMFSKYGTHLESCFVPSTQCSCGYEEAKEGDGQ